MKKITLLLTLLYSFFGFSQIIDEGFEGTTFPPANWLITDNGVGLANSWDRSNTQPTNSGTWTGFMTRENIGAGNTSQDWLITQQIAVPATGVYELKFFSRSTLAGNFGTLYQIRVSNNNATQSDLSAYTIIQQYTENDLSVPYTQYEEKTIDLSAFANQNIHIAFVMVFTQPTGALSGDRWLLDDIKVAEKCLEPTNLTASNFTLTGATLSWTNPGSATLWEVEVVQVPNAPTGTGVQVSSTTVTTASLGLTLTQATDYQYYVRALCTSSGSESAWSGPFDFSTTSPGETCDAPILINSIPYVTTDNTSNYGDDYSGAPGCGTGSPYLNGDDVVYSFTATDNVPVTITMTPTAAWSGIFIYNSCANIGVSCIASAFGSNTNPRVIVLPQTAGVTYYIVISTWGTTAATQSTGYGLTIVKNSCTNFTTTYAVVPDCANGPQFFATANITNLGSATSITATSNQGGTPQVVTATGVIQFGPYPNGTNVTLNLQNTDDPNCFSNSPNLTQGFCPATNNLCSGAIPITCGSTEGQTTVGATTAGAPTFTCGTGPGSGGLWYTYVGTGDVVTFSLCGSAYNTKIQVFTGSCGAFTCAGGNDDFCNVQSEVAIISTLGTVYYVYVYGTTGSQGIFTLNTTCVPPPPPPANDECTTATVVPVNTDATCTLVTPGTILGGTQSTNANTCVGTPNDDVWYQFVATQSVHLIDFQNVIGSTTNLNHGLYTSTDLTDPCANLTLVYCSDPNNSYAQNLIPGQTYFIRVYSSGTAILQNTTFDLCVSVPPPPPANDECVTAITLTVNPDTSCTIFSAGTVTSATQSSQANTCAGIANDDVWYQFTATSQAHTIDLNNVVGSTNNLNHAVYTSANATDPCANLTLFYCSDPNSSYNNTFVVGQTYYIRVFSSGNVLGSTSNFNICVGSIAPPITTNTTQYTVPELIQDVLINSTCAIVSNITWSTGTNFGSTNGIGYFDENDSGFPFEDGIVMVTGNALNVPGPNLTTLSDGGGGGWGGDADLEAIILAATGQAMNSQNATKIEFDFIPLISQISFNFLFASDEYGVFQCSYSDAFAFLLTNVAANTTTNLALIPNTTTPVSVVTIRNQLYNAGCPSVNPAYFAFYYGTGGVNPLGAPINFNGVTVPMAASATVTPNNLYKIKMVIADRSDTAYDSAVFLEGGSFELGDLDLGVDLLISSGNAICPADEAVIDTGLNPDEFTFVWYLDGVLLPAETGPSITVTAGGVYSVEAQYNSSNACSATDSIIVEFYEVVAPGVPETLQACDASGFSIFDLTENEPLILAPIGTPSDYTLAYYTSQADADGELNAITLPTTFTNTIPFLQTIYVRINPIVGDCYEVVTFNVTVQDSTPQFTITEDQDLCDGTTSTIVVTPINYTDTDPVTYTWFLDGNPIPGDTNSIVVSVGGIYTVLINFNGCTATGTSTVTVVQYPVLDPQSDVVVCDEYILPALTVGDYFTGTEGTGDLIPALTPITTTQTIYVYAANSTCSSEESFEVIINSAQAPTLPDVTVCDVYVLPTLTEGNYFAQPNGVEPIAAGTSISATQMIYIYAESGTTPNCTSETSFTVTVIDSPTVDTFSDVTACVTYALPNKINGDFYTGPNGTGELLQTGDPITESQTIYVYAETGTTPNCFAQSSFVVTIINASAEELEDVEACGKFILPTLSADNVYYTGSGATGTMLASGTEITATQTIYIYATEDICHAESSFVVTIKSCTIPKGISPNGDGQNDAFDLTGFGVEKLEIFNRYGIKAYSRTNYTNEWYGQTDKGDELPDGTYYYVIYLSTGENQTGWIYINRERQ